MATTDPCPLRYSRRSAEISTAAPRRCTAIKRPLPAPASLAAARKLAVLVLKLERPKLLVCLVDERGIHHPLRREFLRRHLVGDIPGIDVEHAGCIDLAVRAARGPR